MSKREEIDVLKVTVRNLMEKHDELSTLSCTTINKVIGLEKEVNDLYSHLKLVKANKVDKEPEKPKFDGKYCLRECSFLKTANKEDYFFCDCTKYTVHIQYKLENDGLHFFRCQKCIDEYSFDFEKVLRECTYDNAAPSQQQQLLVRVVAELDVLLDQYDIDSFEFEDYHDKLVTNVLPTLFIKFKEKK